MWKQLREKYKKTTVLTLLDEQRAYVSQGCIGIIRHVGDQHQEPQYLATSGIAPCIGITMYSFAYNETIAVLGHFDSSNAPHIANYFAILKEIMATHSDISVTLIPSTTSFNFVGVNTKSVLQRAVDAGGVRELTQEMIFELQRTNLVHMYDLAVMAIIKLLPTAKFKLAPFATLDGIEDVCMDVYTGTVYRYIEQNTDVVSLKPYSGICSRKSLSIPLNMRLYFLEEGQMRLIRFADDVAAADSVFFPQVSNLPSSSSFSTLAIIPSLLPSSQMAAASITTPSSTLSTLTALGGSRIGLKDVKYEQVSELLLLPDGYKIGKVIDGGDCFFDALAQVLNQMRNASEFSEKGLRVSCHQYYMAHTEEVDLWNAGDGVSGGVKGEDYLFVQYTKPELDKYFNKRIPIWGRAQIEGKILCRQLPVGRIHLIEIGINPENEQPMGTHFEITANGEKQNDALVGDYSIPTIIVSQNDLHFVPVLRTEAGIEDDPPTFVEKEEDKTKISPASSAPQPEPPTSLLLSTSPSQ